MSLNQLLLSLFVFSILVFSLSASVTVWAKPWGYKTLSETLFEIARTRSTASLDSGVFSELGPMSIYAEKIDHRSGRMRNVLVHDRSSEDLSQVIFATQGRIVSNPQSQEIVFVLENGASHEVGANSYSVTQFESNRISLSAAELYADGRDGALRSREMSGAELRQELSATAPAPDTLTADEQQQYHQRMKGHVIELEQRYATPFAALIFVFLAMPLGIHPPRTQRTWGIGLSVAVALFVFLIYFGVLSFGLALAQAETLPPRLAVWIPNFLSAVAAIYCLRKMSTEQWASTGQALEQVVRAVLRPFGRRRGVA